MRDISPWDELTDLRHDLLDTRHIIKGLKSYCNKGKCPRKKLTVSILKGLDYHIQKIHETMDKIAKEVDERGDNDQIRNKTTVQG